MADIAVENYKKGVANALDRWAKKVKPVAEQIDKLNQALKALLKNKSPSPEEKKKIDDCKAARDKLQKKIENFDLELKTDLMLLDMPQKGKADEKEIIKLPKWIDEIVKKKGITVGTVTVAPDIDIDFKAGKLKKVGLTIEFNF
jgi:hypothetical protein